jgi:uncharacterized membrane protein
MSDSKIIKLLPDLKDKLLASLSYISLGIFGFICLLLGTVKSRFGKFHVYQSILMGLLFYLAQGLISFLQFVLMNIFNFFKFHNYKVVDLMGLLPYILLLIVLIICFKDIIKGKLSNIKFLSDQIHKML